MNSNRRSPSSDSRKADNSVAAPKTLDAMRAHPHFEVTLTARTDLETIADVLLEACSGLFPGERPTIMVDRRNILALISVSEHQVERLQYKSWIEHRPSGMRYPCRFLEGTLGVPQKRVSVKLLGAKFAFLKSQQHVRDHLKKSEPLIRANWQQCTGAEYCYVHLHYSSEDSDLLAAVEELREFLETEASQVLLESLPLHVPPCDRFSLSVDNGFRKVAYDHNVSPWTRTQRDSPLGPEWCTFATDTAEKMAATIEAYKEFARANPQFNLKVLGDSSKASPSTQRRGAYAKKIPRSPTSGSTSPVTASSPPSSNSPVETLDLPMAPVMRQGAAIPAAHYSNGPSFEGFTPVPTVSAAIPSNGRPYNAPRHAHHEGGLNGFGPRRDRGAPARAILSNDAAPTKQSPPSPAPIMNSNAPSDLPPGLNLANMHIAAPPMSLPVYGYAPAVPSFQSLMSGFPQYVPDHQYVANPFMSANPSDDVWGKYSPPTESFIPTMVASGNTNAALNSSLSYSDLFVSPADTNRFLSLTDSTGLSG